MDQVRQSHRSSARYYDAEDNRVLWDVAEGASCLPSVIWHITDRCPLSCPFCFATKTRDEVDTQVLQRVTTGLELLGTAKVDIAGGEPLVCQALPEVHRALVGRAVAMTITTSGVGSPRLRAWLVRHAPTFARVIVSIDGPPGRHDLLRGRAGVAAGAAQLARELVARGARVRINTVVTRGLLGHPGGLTALAALVVELGVREWMLIQPHPANAKSSYTSHEITDEDFHAASELARAAFRYEACSGDVPELLFRDHARYSGYHVIYPDGVLRRHTEGPVDVEGVEVAPENVGAVVEFVRMASLRPGAAGPTKERP